MMTLRSIPPATRQNRPIRIGVGLTLGPVNAGLDTSVQFQPRTITPQSHNQRELYHKALRSLSTQLDELIATAIEPGEIEFWKDAKEKLEKYSGQ